MVPKKWSPSGKRWPHYFKTETLAAEFCRTVKRRGVSAFDQDERVRGTAPVLTSYEQDSWKSAVHILCRKLGGDISVLYQAADHWIATRINVKGGTIEEVINAFDETRKREGKSERTRKDDGYRLKTLTEHFPSKDISTITQALMHEYFDGLKGNHRSIYKSVNLFFGWAHSRNYVAMNPMEKIEPIGEFGVNNEYYQVAEFQRMLQITAGLPDPKNEVEPTREFLNLLPFLILSGLGGLRSCEAAKLSKDRDALRWTDLHFDAEIPCIEIRAGVSKTGKKNLSQWVDKSYAIEAIKAWLPLVEHSNPDFVCPIGYAAIGDLKKRFRKATGINFTDNGLRNSVATYGLAYDGREGAGSIAKWLRNSEKVLLSNYARPLPTGSGQKWFNLRPQTAFNLSETQSAPTEQAA